MQPGGHTVAGTMMHCSDWCIDVQHAVNNLNRNVAAPTRVAFRRLTHRFIIMKDVYLRMVPHTSEQNFVCWVDGD